MRRVIRQDRHLVCLLQTQAGSLNVTHRYYPALVPHRIVFDGVVLPSREAKREHEVSLEQKETEKTKLRFLRFLLFKTYFV